MKRHQRNTYRKQLYIFYSKSNLQGRDVSVGLEISEGAKYSANPKDLTQAEGRIQLRFFNTSQGRDDQIKFSLEPFEAYSAFLKLHELSSAPGPLRLEMPPHSFSITSDRVNKITTSVVFEKENESGYAIIAARNGTSHNVSFQNPAQILYIAEVLKHLSISQGWVDFLVNEESEPKR